MTEQPASFVFGQATPDASLLAAGQRPVQAGGCDRAAAADQLGHLDLGPGGPDVVVREEQVRADFQAGGVVPPVGEASAIRGRTRGRGAHGAYPYPSATRRPARTRDREP